MSQGNVVVDMNAANDASNPKEREKKKHEPLFGPNIGIVSSGPAWTNLNEKKIVTDELTPDVVKTWVEKSREAQPTTTLQALVNLKRPTLRLSPLTASAEDAAPPGSHQHGLEFEYDCDAPKCGIYVTVLLSPDHPDASPHFAPGLTKVVVYESVVSGRFSNKLAIQDGAMIELGRFEHTSSTGRNSDGRNASNTDVTASAAPQDSSSANDTSSGTNASTGRNNRKRFTAFHFRKRAHTHNHSVSGPALAVVDAEPSPATDSANKDKEEAHGVRLIIRLVALDEQGTELASPNEQVTYLHVVRFGSPVEEGEEDARSWVVRVVKREATIGPHTFHLHEIYGLSSKSTHASAPTAPLPSEHTYPPAADATGAAAQPAASATGEDELSSECLLCLSSPREVVLLPCRHLVACKECAINMVEFGAGGNIVQNEEPVGDGGDATAAPEGTSAAAQADGTTPADATPGETTAAAAPPVADTPAATTTRRRKRKAKGWFCPVCRQPYTSLLRITTSPPPPETKEETSGDPLAATTGETSLPSAGASPGLLAFRTSLMRQFGRNPPPPDLERGQGVASA